MRSLFLQSLEPIYKQLGEKMKKLSPDVVIAKMDATANDKMPGFAVSGFPTIYFAAKDAKDKVGERRNDASMCLHGPTVEPCIVAMRAKAVESV